MLQYIITFVYNHLAPQAKELYVAIVENKKWNKRFLKSKIVSLECHLISHTTSTDFGFQLKACKDEKLAVHSMLNLMLLKMAHIKEHFLTSTCPLAC